MHASDLVPRVTCIWESKEWKEKLKDLSASQSSMKSERLKSKRFKKQVFSERTKRNQLHGRKAHRSDVQVCVRRT